MAVGGCVVGAVVGETALWWTAGLGPGMACLAGGLGVAADAIPYSFFGAYGWAAWDYSQDVQEAKRTYDQDMQGCSQL